MISAKDLELTTELTQGALTSNALTIKNFVDARLEDYRPELYIGKADEAKKDRAELNKAADKINDARKELEKEFNKPFEEFKQTITSVVKSIKAASSQLDAIVKEEETREKSEKREKIEAIWNKKGFELVPLEKIFNTKWLNKSVKLSTIESDIDSIQSCILADLDILQHVDENDVPLVKSVYLDTLNISEALKYADTLKANRERLAHEREAKQAHAIQAACADQRHEEHEERREQAIEDTLEPLIFDNGQLIAPVEAVKPKPPISFALLFSGKRDDLLAMRQFMSSHNITYVKLTDNGDGTYNA